MIFAGQCNDLYVFSFLAIAFTPKYTGKIKVILYGDTGNSTSGDGETYQLVYGTGTAPSNQAAATGTQLGVNVNHLSHSNFDSCPFTIGGYITGLTLYTAYWFDLIAIATTGGTATPTSICCIVEEIQT